MAVLPGETSLQALPHSPGPLTFIHWSAAFAGAVTAAAISLVLIGFGAAIGLGVASSSASWRDASVALSLLSGLYLLAVVLAAFGAGGYIAGRMRTRWSAAPVDEVEFRDGAHGLLVWAIAVLIAALVAGIGGGNLAGRQSPTASASPATTGEPIIAYELDRLFRVERATTDVDFSYARAEAYRAIMTSVGRREIARDDLAYLNRLVAGSTGVAPAEAERRVLDTVARSREAVSKARRSAVILAFMSAASLLLGAAAAWFAAGVGGRHRDEELAPSMAFGRNFVRSEPMR